jgi:hypothetical protein
MPIDFTALKKPFPPEDVEWRIQSSGEKNGKIWAMVLAYITNRAIMDRLDEVCGPGNWKNKFDTGPQGGVICCIAIKVDGEWVEKWDGADKTAVEEVKGGLSGAMKRAGVQWGIGRYLYDLDAGWAKISDNGKFSAKLKEGNKWFRWDPPDLPAWALPEGKKATKPATQAPATQTQKQEPVNEAPTVQGFTYADAEWTIEEFVSKNDRAGLVSWANQNKDAVKNHPEGAKIIQRYKAALAELDKPATGDEGCPSNPSSGGFPTDEEREFFERTKEDITAIKTVKTLSEYGTHNAKLFKASPYHEKIQDIFKARMAALKPKDKKAA